MNNLKILIKNQPRTIFAISVIIFIVSLGIGICIGHFGIQKSFDNDNPTAEAPLNNEKNNEKDYKAEAKKLEAMYDTFDIMVNYLNKYNVTFMLTGGTLIGSKRNFPPGPMTWDDDLDFMIYEGEDDKVQQMIKDKEFNELIDTQFYSYDSYSDFYQFKSKKYMDIGKTYMLDLFYLREFKDKVNPEYKEYKYWMQSFPKDGFVRKEDFDPEPCQFWAREVNCPKTWKYYLDKVYPDWDTIVRQWNHDGAGIQKGNDVFNITLMENKFNLVSAIPPQLVETLEFKQKVQEE